MLVFLLTRVGVVQTLVDVGVSETLPRRFRGGLAFKALRLLHHSTQDLKVIKKKKKETLIDSAETCGVGAWGFEPSHLVLGVGVQTPSTLSLLPTPPPH